MEPFTILMVDDDQDDLMIMAEAIKEVHQNVQVIFANDGERAIETMNILFEQQDHICLVVLDLNMPKMNGTQTLMALKNDPRFSHIPIVIYSTSVNVYEKEKCLALGANAYVTKPLTHNQSIQTATFFIGLCKPRMSV